MGKVDKLMMASDRVELPKQETYELAANKMFYFTQVGVAALVAVMLFLSTRESSSVYYSLIMVGAAIYAILALYMAFTQKVTFDQTGITMPGVYPFMKERLAWDDVQSAELTGVITYRSYLVLIIKKIFSSVFANLELNVVHRSISGGGKCNFPIFDRVSDKATALRIIREKLGDRFCLYGVDTEE